MVAVVICIAPSLLLISGKIVLPVFSMRMKDSLQKVGEKNAVITKLEAMNVFPFARIEMKYNIYHSMEEEKSHRFTDYFSLFGGSKEYSYTISFDYCGIYHIKAEEIKVMDMIGLVSVMLPPVEAHAIIMPTLYDIKVTEEKLSLNRQEENFTDPTKGYDVSEIKELREYRDGDKLSQVHWKLSTKSEDLIVKEYERQAGTCIVISCDASYKTLKEINAYYDFLYSFGIGLLKAEYFFNLVYFDKLEQTLIRLGINNSYDFEIAIQNMYYNVVRTDIASMEEFYRENFGKSKLFILTGEELDEAYYRYVDSHEVFRIFAEI